MSSSSNTNSGGVGFLGLLAILFIGLKLGGVISWSWGWVLLPLYGPLVLVLLFMAFVFTFTLIKHLSEKS